MKKAVHWAPLLATLAFLTATSPALARNGGQGQGHGHGQGGNRHGGGYGSHGGHNGGGHNSSYNGGHGGGYGSHGGGGSRGTPAPIAGLGLLALGAIGYSKRRLQKNKPA